MSVEVSTHGKELQGSSVLSGEYPQYALLLVLFWLLGTMLLWAFAFYPVESADAAWLARARQVCFGMSADGLPDGGGWLLLTLAPLFFLSAVIVAFGSELSTAMRVLLSEGVGRVVAAIVLLTVVGEALWVGNSINDRMTLVSAQTSMPTALDELPQHYPTTNTPAPEFALLNQHGQEVSLGQFNGKAVVLTFAFAHCQTVCPMLITVGREALRQYPTDRAQFIIVTLDPWRDTPGALKSIHTKWDLPDNALVLSGTKDQIAQVQESYSYTSERDQKTGDIVHPATVYVIRPDGTLAYTFNSPSVRWLVGAIESVLAPQQVL